MQLLNMDIISKPSYLMSYSDLALLVSNLIAAGMGRLEALHYIAETYEAEFETLQFHLSLLGLSMVSGVAQ